MYDKINLRYYLRKAQRVDVKRNASIDDIADKRSFAWLSLGDVYTQLLYAGYKNKIVAIDSVADVKDPPLYVVAIGIQKDFHTAPKITAKMYVF